jgi:hypothetical protein
LRKESICIIHELPKEIEKITPREYHLFHYPSEIAKIILLLYTGIKSSKAVLKRIQELKYILYKAKGLFLQFLMGNEKGDTPLSLFSQFPWVICE